MYSNLVVPISFDEDRDAKGALDVATSLRTEGGSITLLHVIETLPNYALAHLPEKILQETKDALVAELGQMAARYPGGTAAVMHGHAGRTITDWSHDHGADCIVIASHRPGMQDLLLGSTAQYVVRHADCAVHVQR